MRIQVHTQGLTLSAVGRQCAEDRLSMALGRATGHVRAVDVYVADENGPKGGLDKTCRVAVNLDAGPPVVVRHRAPGVGAAVGGAADRVARAVAQAVARIRQCRRQRLLVALRKLNALYRRGGKEGRP